MKPVKILLFCSLAVLSITGHAQRIRSTEVVEGGIFQPEGLVPPSPADNEITLPYLVGDSIFAKSSRGVFKLVSVKTSRTPGSVKTQPTASNRQRNALRFSSVARFKKLVALPEPPVGWYVQGIDTAGRYVLIRPNAKFTLSTGALTPPSGNTDCATVGPKSINGNNPLTAYQSGANWVIDTDWSGGTAPFAVAIRNAANSTTYTETSPDRIVQKGIVAASGTSTLIVTDAGGCSTSATVTVTATAPPVTCSNPPTALGGGSAITAYTNGGGQKVVDLSWSNGTAPFLVTLTNAQGSITYTESSTDRIVVAAPVGASGTTIITVTDANSCSVTGSVSVAAPSGGGGCSGGPTSINGGSALSSYVHSGTGQRVVDATWSAGVAPFQVVLRNASNQVTFTETSDDRIIINATVAATGASTLTITDANNCSVTGTVPAP